MEATVEKVMVSSTSCQENSAPGELRETAEATQRSLSELRLLLANEVTLDCPTDDKFLLKFLRAASIVRRTHSREYRSISAQGRDGRKVFSDLSPSTVNYETVVAQHRLVIVSKQVDPKGRIVGLTRMGSWNSAICPLTEFFRACIVLAEWSLLNEEAQLRGVVGVIDLKGLELSHIATLHTQRVRMAAHIGQVTTHSSDARLDCPVDDEFLVKFLRGRKYQVEKAFKTIQKYFRVRKTSVDLFKDLLPTAVPLRAILVDNRLMMLSKGRDCLGRPVALIKMGSWHRSICSLDDLYRAALIMAEWALLDEETQIRGVVGVCDLKGLRAHHLAHFTPLSLKKIAHIVQDCYPARVKAIYVINNPPLCELLYAAVKPFLKSKIVQRISFIGHDLKKLHGILPPDVIPVESGGTHEEFDCYSQEKDVRAAQDYFEYIARYGFRD
ncbi:hypothetical protein HPB48_002359 [Haemaphysalis longicornis]|uniref:CRAL-TRIO domain-containing protein n=1 Tax=Haemaphysalis longicornis TaxID=44386 RepID=A0A9J6GHY5_HAELO|nr:hypothetical protein HPB48_002359 [Haemaphysalis longicornis]